MRNKYKIGDTVEWDLTKPKIELNNKILMPFICTVLVFGYIFLNADTQDKKDSSIKNVIAYPSCYKPNLKVYELHNFLGELSKWDKLRYSTYLLATELNQKYKFGMTDIKLYDSLMKTFYAESTYKTGDKAINKNSGAKGIIQFLKSTRKKLDIPDDINEYALHDQIPFVKRYIEHKIKLHKINTSKIDDFIDVYLIVFAPAYSDNDMDSTLYSKKCKSKSSCKCAYHANKAYDINRDGKINKQEVRDFIVKKHFI